MTILEISEEGILTETVLGQNIMANEQVQYVVKANTWFGSFPNNGTAFSFVGCTVGTWFEHALLSFFPSCLSLSELTHGHLFVFSSLFPMLDACFRLLFIVYCLLFIVHCSLFIVYCLLFIVYCLLFLLIGIFFSTWICLWRLWISVSWVSTSEVSTTQYENWASDNWPVGKKLS